MLFIFQVALEFKKIYIYIFKKLIIPYSALTQLDNTRAVSSLAEAQAYEPSVIGAGWSCSYRVHPTFLMPLHNFATGHPTLLQTLQESSESLSLLDNSFVSASPADGEGRTTSHVCLHISGHPRR